MLSPNATLAQAFIRNQPWHGALSAEQQSRLLERLTFVKGDKGDCLLAQQQWIVARLLLHR